MGDFDPWRECRSCDVKWKGDEDHADCWVCGKPSGKGMPLPVAGMAGYTHNSDYRTCG